MTFSSFLKKLDKADFCNALSFVIWIPTLVAVYREKKDKQFKIYLDENRKYLLVGDAASSKVMKELLGTLLKKNPEIEIVTQDLNDAILKEDTDINLMFCSSVSSGVLTTPEFKDNNILSKIKQQNIVIVRAGKDKKEDVTKSVENWRKDAYFMNTPLCIYSNYHSPLPYLATIPFGMVRLYIGFVFRKRKIVKSNSKVLIDSI